jgi:hypothetical protein
MPYTPTVDLRTPAPNAIPVVDSEGQPLKRGDRVCIPKGVRVTGTFAGGEKTTGRAYQVVVYNALNGWIANERAGEPEHAPSVSWAGTGGYWHQTDSRLVTLVED